MVAYRFCRPDDSPYIVQAINKCFHVHFPDEDPLTLEAFQSEVRELDVWPSNCMVASDSSEPVAVCIATKRPDEVLIYRVGARPGFERQGHGRHMLTSLSQKLAVLGPSRLVVELPGDRTDLISFFEAAGYLREAVFTDYVLTAPLRPPADVSLLTPLGVEDVEGLGLLAEEADACWERQLATLRQRRDQIRGWGLVAGDALAGFILFRDAAGERQILASQVDPSLGRTVAELLFAGAASDNLPLRMVKTGEDELERGLTGRLGFEPDAVTLRYAAEARPL